MSETTTQAQSDLTNSLTQTLQDANNAISQINTQLQSQSDILSLITESIGLVTSGIHDFNLGLTNTNEILSAISEVNLSNLSTGLGQNANNALNAQHVNVESFNALFTNMMNQMATSFSDYNTQQQQAASSVQAAAASERSGTEDLVAALGEESSRINSLNEALRSRAEANQALSEELEGFSAASFVKNTAIGGIKAIISAGPRVISAMIGIATQVGMAMLTLPMTITREMAAVGNKLRQDLVEGLGQSVQDMKEKFDLGSFVGKALMTASRAAESALRQFQDPTSDLVKKFGYGIEGVKKYFTRLGETFDALGHYSEVYADTFSKNKKRYLQFLDIQDALGFSNEDLKYFAMDAYNNVELLEDRMFRMAATIRNVAKSYNVDMKQLSKNTMALRKDIILFGHISDENLTDVALNMTKMKVKIEDAAAVFNKFSTFEDAAKSSAILSQTFGMNINAMDLIRAERPDEIFQMFSDAMELTGRSFSDLSRHEKAIMAQQTGMSAESLNAIMNYKAMGLTFEEARNKMEQDKPEKRQLAALKELKSSIKEINKILTFNSPFEALTKGFMERLVLADDAKSVLTTLSGGYESLYQYALKIKPGTINKLVQPISYIITIMKDIFESEGFKNSVVNILQGMGDLLTTAFNYKIEDIAAINPKKLLTLYDTNRQEGKNSILNIIFELQSIGVKNSKYTYETQEIADDIGELQTGSFSDQKAERLLERIIKHYKLTPEQIKLALPEDVEKVMPKDKENVTGALNAAAENNAENVNKYLDLTQTITGAVFRATFAGLTSLIESGTMQLNKVGKIGNNKTWYENLLGITPEDFEQMNTRLKLALESLFKPSAEGEGGIFSSFLGFFKDQFLQIASEAMSILGTIFGLALNAVLGKESRIDPKNETQKKAYAASRGINEENAKSILEDTTRNESYGDSDKASNTIDVTLPIILERIKKLYEDALNKNAQIGSQKSLTAIDKNYGIHLNEVIKNYQEISNVINKKDKNNIDYTSLVKSITQFENNYQSFSTKQQEILAQNQTPTVSQSTNDLVSVLGNTLPPKSMMKIYDAEGREVDTNSREASLNSGGVVSEIMKQTRDITVDAQDIRNSAQQIYLNNTFNPINQKNKLKQKISELNAKIKETINSQSSKEDIVVTPELDRDTILEIGKVLANNNFVKMLSDPRYTQGGYLIASRSLESPTLNTGELNVAPNYLYDVD